MCGVVCVKYMHICVLHVHGVWLCVHVHLCVPLCQHLQNGGCESTSVLTCIFNHTSTYNRTLIQFWQLLVIFLLHVTTDTK